MSKHKARQKLKIIKAAMELIQVEGMSRVNMSKVAEAAGMTRQTLYNHFTDVENIITKALDMHGKAMLEHLQVVMAEAEGASAKLHAFADFQVSSASAEHETVSFEASLSANARDRIAAHERAVIGLLEKATSEGLKSGDFTSEIDLVILTDLVQGVIKGGVASALRRPAQKSEILESVYIALGAILQEPNN